MTNIESTVESAMENKVVLAVIVAAVIGLLSWNVWTTQKLSVDVAVLQSTVEQNSLPLLGTTIALQEQRITRLEDWLDRLSTRVTTNQEATR